MNRPKPTKTFFKPKTHHEFASEELFDSDISGLHKLVQPKKILTKNVRYIPPSIAQVPFMMSFMIEAFQDLIMSPDEINSMNRNDVFLRVVEFVAEATKGLQEEDQEAAQEAERILGSAFSSKAAISYLIPVMSQCFPDISFFRATNECFIECFNALFEDMFVSEE